MFALKRIINGRVNVSEPLHIAANVTSPTTFAAGTAVSFDSKGVLAPVKGDATAEYVVWADTACPVGGTVPVILITKDMLFDVPMSVTPTGVAAGKKLTIADDSASVTATAVTDNFGAYVVDTNGAAAAGDVITVRLA